MTDIRTTALPDRPTREMVSSRTRFLLRILGLVFLVMLGVLVVRVISGDLAWWQLVGGLAVGAVVGMLLGRMNRVSWDQSTGTVVSQMDAVGIAMLVAYVAFALSRSRIADVWVDGAHAVAGVALALSAGSIAGRVLFLLRGIGNAFEVAGLGRRRS